ncbi:MAG: Gfo/Idh/MocA family oxidoreductase [Chloroflexi bacterium]|nr:Gfo/Idh/MocA family oxidoreductase [Chloroflexota bacterium]
MTINAAFIGAGNVARAHLSALRECDAVHACGIFDLDRARAEERAIEFGVPRVYGSWRELLDDPDVDVAGVLLPHDLHRQYTVEALDAGKHVVCEKPMAATLEECDAMLAAAHRTGRRLFPVQNRLYHPAYEKMGELVRQNAIGAVFLAQTNGFEGPRTVSVRPWLGTERRGGGVLMAQAVHPAYALRWLLGDVAQVSCTFGRRKVVEMVAEDTAIVTLAFESGTVAEMTATFGLKYGPFDHAIMLYGAEGYIELRASAGDRTRPQSLRAIAPRLFGDQAVHELELRPVTHPSADFRHMWEDYARAIETGGPAQVADVDGRKAVEIILAAHRSNELGTTMPLPL